MSRAADEFPALIAKHGQGVEPEGPKPEEKAVRARPASAQPEAGNVKLLRSDWNTAFLDEVCSFPAGRNDDQVDAFADVLNELALDGPGYSLLNV